MNMTHTTESVWIPPPLVCEPRAMGSLKEVELSRSSRVEPNIMGLNVKIIYFLVILAHIS